MTTLARLPFRLFDGLLTAALGARLTWRGFDLGCQCGCGAQRDCAVELRRAAS